MKPTVHMCEFWRESEVYLIRIYAHGKITWRARVYPHVPSFSIHTVAYRLAHCKIFRRETYIKRGSSYTLTLESSRIEGVGRFVGSMMLNIIFAKLFEVSFISQSFFLPVSNANTYRCGFFVRSGVRITVYKGGNFATDVWVSTCRNATSTLIQSEAHSNDSLQVFYISRHGMLNVNGPTGKPSTETIETDMSLHDCSTPICTAQEKRFETYGFCILFDQ